MSMDAVMALQDMEVDTMSRGRTRDRTLSRVQPKPIRAEESSTFRGRSRQRAASPNTLASYHYPSHHHAAAAAAPHFPKLSLYHQLRDTRRQHCPSRPASPSRVDSVLRRHRSRSRPRARRQDSDTQSLGLTESHSGLRNEVFAGSEDEHSKQESDVELYSPR